jgi:hypothetical protein
LTVKINGVVKRRRTVGFGPFTREKWEPESFRAVVEPGKETHALEGVTFMLNQHAEVWQVEAIIKSVHFVLWSIPDESQGTPRRSRFSVLSVAKIQIYGQILVNE